MPVAARLVPWPRSGCRLPDTGTRSVIVTLVLAIALSSLASAQTASRPMSWTRAVEVLEVAEGAAENRMQALSLRAAHEALRHGLPRPVEEQDSPGEFLTRFNRLIARWQDRQFDTVAVWETLRDISFPPDAPQRMELFHRFATDLQGSASASPPHAAQSWQPESPFCVVLIQSAARADRIQELVRLLEDRQRQSDLRASASIALLAVATESGDADAVTRRLDDLVALPEELPPIPDVAWLASQLLKLQTTPENANAAEILVDRATNAMMRFEPGSVERGVAREFVLRRSRELFISGRGEDGVRTLRSCPAPQHDPHDPEAQAAEARVIELLLVWGYPEVAVRRLYDWHAVQREHKGLDDRAALAAAEFFPLLEDLPAELRYTLLRDSAWHPVQRRVLLPVFQVTEQDPVARVFLETLPSVVRAALERRQGHSSVSEAGGVSLEHSAQVLIDTAAETRQLHDLTLIIKDAIGDDSLAAWYSALLATGSDSIEDAEGAVANWINGLPEMLNHGELRRRIMLQLALAQAACRRASTRSLGLNLLQQLQSRPELLDRYQSPLPLDRTLLQSLLSERLAESDSSPGEVLAGLAPACGPGVSMGSAGTTIPAASHSTWLSDGLHVVHAGGGGDDELFLPWPLEGEFEFSAMSLLANGHAGGLGAGGVICCHDGPSQSTLVMASGTSEAIRRSSLNFPNNSFHRRAVKVRPASVSFLINGHVVSTVPRRTAEPLWLSLAAHGSQRGVWRDVQLTGHVEVPRRIVLSADPALAGWNVSWTGPVPPEPGQPLSAGAKESKLRTGWLCDGMEIHGPQRAATITNALLPPELTRRLLQYNRPLRAGERIDWQFEWQPGRSMVHPALGRLVLLLRPEGVALHWLTQDLDRHPVLRPDHEFRPVAATAQVSLQPGWNSASLELQRGAAELIVNETRVFRWTIDPDHGTQFGLCYFPQQSEARVRNVVLSGDWPQEVTPELLTAALQPRESTTAKRAGSIVSEFLGDQAAFSLGDRILRLRGKSEERQREELRSLVLPDPESGRVVVAADLIELADALNDVAGVPGPRRFREELKDRFTLLPVHGAAGASLLSPAIEYVQRLAPAQVAETRRKLVSADASGLAMKVLLAIAARDTDSAREALDQLAVLHGATPVVDRTTSGVHEAAWWPAIVAAHESLDVPGLREPAIRLLDAALTRSAAAQVDTVNGPSMSVRQELFAGSLRSLALAVEKPPVDKTEFRTPSGRWRAFRAETAQRILDGLPAPVWVESRDGSVRQLAGSDGDILCWSQPLTGDFEFECELSNTGGGDFVPGYGGEFFVPARAATASDPARTARRISYAGGNLEVAESPEISAAAEFRKMRMTTSGGRLQVRVNGVLLLERELTTDCDPWLYLRGAPSPGAEIRNARVSGGSTPPMALSRHPGFSSGSWRPPFHAEPATDAVIRQLTGVNWNFGHGQLLIGNQRSALQGSGVEQTAVLFRPLLEDSAITWSFQVQQGQLIAYPAIGRLALILDPQRGVTVHRMSLGPGDSQAPDRSAAAVDLGESLVPSLPLRTDDWNEMQLELRGDIVTLSLNGVAVFRLPLPRDNDRSVSVFYFPGESGVRVRDVMWHRR